MPKKKQVTLQNSIPGKFIPRNALPSGSGLQLFTNHHMLISSDFLFLKYIVFPSRGNDNRLNAKMAELLASSSITNDVNNLVSTKSSQDNEKSNEIPSIESPNIHSKVFHRRIVTMLETMRKVNDNSSTVQITSAHSEYKSQPITFGQLRKANISSVPAQVIEDKSISYQVKTDIEEKQDKPVTSFVKEHSLNSNAGTLKSSIKRQTTKERLHYSPSLEQLFQQQNSVSETRSDEKEIQKPSLSVDEILATRYAKLHLSTNTESYTTATTFYMHPSISSWNSLNTNSHINQSRPQTVVDEQARNRPPPPSYSASIATPHRPAATGMMNV